jgi:copper chaperone
MQKTYRVEGMTCCGCANSIEQAIKTVAPDAMVEVDVAASEVTVKGIDDDELIKAAVEDAGFDFGGIA